mmetsp:Transcript_41409/g.76488  ORF Transcript_41409/g.76488 Transcript_41409/m.76488 type:complete len:103 (-) Transcript_41409:6-314(-)
MKKKRCCIRQPPRAATSGKNRKKIVGAVFFRFGEALRNEGAFCQPVPCMASRNSGSFFNFVRRAGLPGESARKGGSRLRAGRVARRNEGGAAGSTTSSNSTL